MRHKGGTVDVSNTVHTYVQVKARFFFFVAAASRRLLGAVAGEDLLFGCPRSIGLTSHSAILTVLPDKRMPTVLLLDLASSLGRTVAPDLTRQDLVQRCALHFLRALEELQPHEQFSLMTYAAAANTAVSFTRDHSLLRSALYDVQLHEGNTQLEVGLRGAFDLIEQKWGLEVPAQVVVFTDGVSGNVQQLLAVRTLARVRVHLVAFGSKSEMNNADALRQLAHSHYGCFSFLQLPEVCMPHPNAFLRL